MFVLKPIIHETIWGGKRLQKYVEDCDSQIGHLYLVNGHAGTSNIIMNGNYCGKTLKEAFDAEKFRWKMGEYEEFPLTIALVDASDSLSIQVHPDNIAAERIEGERIGKMESWLFLEKLNTDWIYAGCLCDTKKDLESAVMDSKVEEIVGRLQISPNDYVYIEAGTLHAMTAGSLVYEIEYGSDYTYRFYDYNRTDGKGNKRELHIDKAIEAVKLGIQPKVHRNVGGQWISEEKYEIRKVEYIERYENTGNKVECIVLLEGNGVLEGCKVSGGMGILLLPGEKLEEIDIRSGIIARVR